MAGAPLGRATPWAWVLLGVLLQLLWLPPGPAGFLVLVADVPFLWLLWYDGGRRWKRWAFLYGALHFGVGAHWVLHVTPVFPVTLALCLAPVYLLFGAAIRLCARGRLPFVASVGVCAVLEELLRTVWLGGMPWPARSLAFAGDGALALDGLLPAASLLGAYAFSFLAGATSAWASGLLALWGAGPRRGELGRTLAGAAILPLVLVGILIWAAGARRDDHETRRRAMEPSARIFETQGSMVLVQGNVDQDLKHRGDRASLRELVTRHTTLAVRGMEAAGERRPFTVMWPETMQPYPFTDTELAARYPEMWWAQIRVLQEIKAASARWPDANWLIGALHFFRRGREVHVEAARYGNHDSLFQVVPRYVPDADDPFPQPDLENRQWFPPWERGRHDKVVLVPGGEYTPLGEVIPPLRWLRNFVSVIPELDPGDEDVAPFLLVEQPRWSRTQGRAFQESVRAGSVICFEIAFPARCRAWRTGSPGAQVLLNAANYGWFGQSAFRAQIRAVARLRAAELAMSVAMAGNTGPTLFLDPLGRPHGTFHPASGGGPEPAGGDGTTHREGVVVGRLLVDPRPTLYAQVGDLPWLVFGLLWLMAAFGASRRRSMNVPEDPAVDVSEG